MRLLVAQLAIHCDSVHPQGSASQGSKYSILSPSTQPLTLIQRTPPTPNYVAQLIMNL